MSSSWLANKKALARPLEEDWPLLLSVYAVIIVPAAGMALIEASAIFLFIALAACAMHAMLVGPNDEPLFGVRTANALAALLLLVFASQADLESVRMGYTPVHFIVSLQLIKLFGRHRLRDIRVIQFISVFELLVAARWAETILFFPFFVMTVAVLLLNCVMLAMRPNRDVRCRRRSRWTDLVAGFRLPGLLLVAFAIVLFFAFPRFRLTGAPAGLTMGRVSGFTRDVSLREIGSMRESHNVALRVTFSEIGNEGVGILAPKSLMRGTTYTSYENGRWTSPPQPFARGAGAQSELAMGAHDLLQMSGVPIRYIRQEITLEPQTGDTLFALYVPLQVESDDFGHHRRRATSEIVLRGRQRLRRSVEYEVLSAVPEWREQDLRQAGAPDFNEQWSQMWEYPPELERVLRATVRQIEQQYQPNTDLDRAYAIEQYLRNPQNFSYSIDLPPLGNLDPVEAFLTETRVGSCEQFASAMVLLLRAWGIPARLVGGFKGGSREEGSTEYVFRDSDAHAWLEVFFTGHGWVEFDPTPGSASTSLGDMMGGADGGSFGSRMRRVRANLLRQAEVAWNLYIVNYGADQQNDMMDAFRKAMQELGSPLPGAGGEAQSLFRGVVAMVLAAVALFVVAMGLHLLLGVMAGRRQRARRRGYDAEGFYGEMLRLLQERGFVRHAHTTPREFARRARTRLESSMGVAEEAVQAVIELTEWFCRTRYGGKDLSAAENARVAGALEQLRAMPQTIEAPEPDE